MVLLASDRDTTVMRRHRSYRMVQPEWLPLSPEPEDPEFPQNHAMASSSLTPEPQDPKSQDGHNLIKDSMYINSMISGAAVFVANILSGYIIKVIGKKNILSEGSGNSLKEGEGKEAQEVQRS
uniref:Uncharacterized protein n=1 Tax=Timema monikensis TaxID=170555 RepID=A0A7R9EG36_9NEOP|nr:unnamed protein product [Timema monikensis]